MANSEKPIRKDRRSYEELDRESQYKQTVRLIEQHPEEATERATRWNKFIAEHPDFAEVPMTFEAVKKWAEDKKVDLPYASTIMRDRDIADTIASDKARAEGTWAARVKKAKPRPAPIETPAPATATAPEPDAQDGETTSKNRRKKRELTPEQKEDAALAAEWGFSYKYDKEPVVGERLPLAGAPKPPSYDVELPPLFNREHWHANHAKSEPYKERKKRELAAKLAAEGYFEGLPKPGDRDFVPESPAEFAAHTQALLDSSQEITGPDTARATIAGMEKPPRATPAPAETGELSSKETAERYLDYYDHRDDTPVGPPQVGNVQHDDPGAETGPEGPDAVVDVGDVEKPAEAVPVAAPELDLTKVADANVAFEEEEEPKTATPAEAEPAAAPDLVVPQEEVDRHNAEQGKAPEATEKIAERGEEVVEKSGFKEWEKDWIRNWGRKYNEMSKTKKIILGATLGATAAAGIAFGSPIALAAGLFGTSLQRISGGLGMFVHAENYMLGENAKKERGNGWFEDFGRQWKTAAAALAYAGLATFGIKKAIDYTADWLGHMWPGDVTDGPSIGEPINNIVDKLSTAPEAPGVTVEATQGKGYEYMAKRLWEQLHGADSTLVDQDFITQHPESDAAKLWNAPADKIDAVVHQIATERGFYQPDAENVLIKPNSVLGFTPDGDLRLGVPGGSEVIDAAPDASVTPPYNPEAPAPEAAPDASAATTAPEHAVAPDAGAEASAPQTGSPEHSFVNKHGIEVFDSEPNLYTDGSGKELYVYGGDAQQQAGFIEKFYSNPQNADKVLYGSDQAGETRVAWRLTNGQLTPAAVPKASFLGFGRGFEKAPSPDDLRMLIK